MTKENDHRLSQTLHKGDQIRTGNVVYTISGTPLGFGGTSVLYPATRSDSILEFAVKECFPGGSDRFHRSGGVIRPVDPKDAEAIGQLEQYRRQLQLEKNLGQTIRNTSTRAIGIWDILTPTSVVADGKLFTDVSDGVFSVLERMDRKGMTFHQLLQYIAEQPSEDAPLKTGGLPRIHHTVLIMEQVLLALQRVHEAGDSGFVFGDIQSDNIFFSDCRLAQGDIGIGNLLDFGCARPLVDGKQTAQITDRQVFSTAGFIPPELLDPEKNDGTLRLTPASDIYSTGCLMLRCLLRSGSIRRLGASPMVGTNAIDAEAAARLGCTESIRSQLNNILQKALQPDPQERYQDAQEMLEDIQKLKRDTAPPSFLLPDHLSAPDYFVEGSRDREVSQMLSALHRREVVYIWGDAGIGKTETAIQLAKSFPSAKGAWLIHYQNSMRETILSLNFDGYTPNTKGTRGAPNESADYRARLSILKNHYSGALLIFDNFDVDGKSLDDLRKEPAFQELCGLPIYLVFTTRSPVSWQPENELHSLSEAALLNLMRRYCPNPSVSDQAFLSLIRTVGGNTLAVSLIAKTLQASDGELSPEDLLRAFHTGRVYPDMYPTVATDQNRSFQSASLFGHLRTLFDLSVLDQASRSVMGYCAFLSPDGMDLRLFRRFLPEPQNLACQNLIQRGWIRKSNHNTIQVHPLVQAIVRSVIREDSGECRQFLSRIHHYCDSESRAVCTLRDGVAHWGENQLTGSELRQLADWVCAASDFAEPPSDEMLWFSTELLMKLRRPVLGKRYLQQALDLESSIPDGLASALYHHRATTALYIYDWALCKQHGTLACAQWETVLGSLLSAQEKDDALHNYALTCYWLCRTYTLDFHYAVSKKQCGYRQAIQYGEKVLELELQRMAPDFFLISMVHQLLATTCRAMYIAAEDFSRGMWLGLENYSDLKKIRAESKQRSEAHIREAISYANRIPVPHESWSASLLEAMGDILPQEAALPCYQQALQLRLGTDAKNAESYSMIMDNIGSLYYKTGDSRRAFDYKKKKLDKTTDVSRKWYYFYLEWLLLKLQNLDSFFPQTNHMFQTIRMFLLVVVLIPIGIVTLVALLGVLWDTILEAIRFFKQNHQDRSAGR